MTSQDAQDLNFDDFPPEVRKFRSTVREFARDEVLPRALKNDQDAADAFDWDLVQKGHEIGMTRAIVSKEYGGLGVGVVGVALALEEIAAADPGVALTFGATMLGQAPVLLSGDTRLQARFLPLFSGDDVVLACNAVTEEDAGTDLVLEQSYPHARNVTSIRRDGDEYVLNGRKRFITNAKVASFASVFGNLDGYPGATGLTCIMVPLDSAGVTRGAVADKMGYRNCLGTEIHFDNVRVPVENLVGGEAEGGPINIAQGNMARPSVAAISTGIARHALEVAREWAGSRVQGGTELWRHQMSARKLADMAAAVEASQLLYRRAAHRVDSELPAPAYEPAVAKMFADRTAIEVASTAMSLMGARGYVKSYGMEKIVRDAFGSRIYEGTPEALALTITECLYEAGDEDDPFE
ncbi:acyl-CoA dehydrogenase family protein [Glycomyces arizonensis]|uniref:acyl-CoA dehydrogenase family protein n=1 Tax=Glycomyces arizonensis TaxID=256035 RepID=UPI00041F7F0C|nr:acyl-CoA dehydrogenase [Glycomyces arizonensis]